ncbi:protein ALP1-like [Prosopis cineraria]|uniref:protein ALP1-like n=1 Tax=Prosopis cineraria TaxID=364024 RepID=UPI00240F97B3|nr:protein ALP1-like [Prosopis cineraria]
MRNPIKGLFGWRSSLAFFFFHKLGLSRPPGLFLGLSELSVCRSSRRSSGLPCSKPRRASSHQVVLFEALTMHSQMSKKFENLLLVQHWFELRRRTPALLACVLVKACASDICSKKISYSLSGKREMFRRSGETISRHFHQVLTAIIDLEEKFLVQPNGSTILPEIKKDKKFFPYFKDCVGAIDGTHIRVKVPSLDAPRYRGRKEFPTQNVLATCTFDLKFTYVLPGWEGTASDSRIIKNALTREDKLIIPEGKYYLVDAGFMLTRGLVTPYRGVRYHLKEYSKRNPPLNYRELFNLRHAKLRNAIERAFGVLKKRFSILSNATEPTYGIKAQNMIIYVCCILHNFLVSMDPIKDLLEEVDAVLTRENHSNDNNRAQRGDNNEAARGELLRENIANQMWADYQEHLATLENELND